MVDEAAELSHADRSARLDEEEAYWYGDGKLAPHTTMRAAILAFSASNTLAVRQQETHHRRLRQAFAGFRVSTQDLIHAMGTKKNRTKRVCLEMRSPCEAQTLCALSGSNPGVPAARKVPYLLRKRGFPRFLVRFPVSQRRSCRRCERCCAAPQAPRSSAPFHRLPAARA